MADTVADVEVSKSAYVDINTLSGIAAGIALVITNKSTSRVRLQIGAGQPAANSEDGDILWPGPDATSVKLIKATNNTVWAKSLDDMIAPISVQNNT